MSRTKAKISLILVALLAARCGGGPAGPAETPQPDLGRISLDDFYVAASLLPPSAIFLTWADVDAIRTSPLSETLTQLAEDPRVPVSTGTTFLRENIDSIHKVAGGMWLTMKGQSILLVLETDLQAEELFPKVEAWAIERGHHASNTKIRGRPSIRVGDTVMVAMGDGVFINGPAGLAGRVVDLADRKVTGNALEDDVVYLAKQTLQEKPLIVATGIAPPVVDEWLEAKHLPSVINSRMLLSVQAPADVGLRLGLLPGKPIKPIWFAQEVNTFLVRAAKDKGVVDLGIADWVENLDVELLSKGIVVKGSMGIPLLAKVLGSIGGEK